MSKVKVRALIEKEQDPKSWNGDMWEDPNEAGDLEPLNSGESSLSVEAGSPSSPEGIDLALPKDTAFTSLKTVAIQDAADSPQDPL